MFDSNKKKKKGKGSNKLIHTRLFFLQGCMLMARGEGAGWGRGLNAGACVWSGCT